jgi:integrase
MPKQKKRLRAKITVGHDADGDAIIKWASGYTKKELEANKEELRRTYINGAVAIRRDILFGEYVVTWYNIYKIEAAAQGGKKIGESTKANYRTAINVHILPAFEFRQMRSITADQLQQFMYTLSKYSRTLIGDVHSVLKNVFSLAYAQGVIDRDVSVALKKPQAADPDERRELTDAETRAMLTLIHGSALPLCDRLFLALLFYLGLRRGEALGIQWPDVDFAKRVIHIRRDIDFETGKVGALKTKAAYRDVPIPEQLFSLLQKFRQIGTQFVVQAPQNKQHWSKSTFDRHWLKFQRMIFALDSSVEHDDNGSILTSHYVRHNYATLLYDANVDVLAAAKMFGHSDVRTMMRIYTHIKESRQLVSAEKIRLVFANIS